MVMRGIKLDELIKHNCSVEGEMFIEKDKPCNWCDELDYLIRDKETKKNDVHSVPVKRF